MLLLHGQMNIKAEVQKMKNGWFENYCWAFPLNHRRPGLDGYLHNLTGILIIVSEICMQMA